MNKRVKILAGVLLLQVMVAVLLFSRGETTASFQGHEPLLALNSDQVDRVVIEEKSAAQTKSVELVKKDGHWLLPAYHDFPVAADKIRKFVGDFAGFHKSWPVAKTDIAAKQFKVTATEFERKISFYQGGKVAGVVYLGTSPSFKKLHAWIDGDPLTYSIAFTTFEAPLSVKEWQEASYLEVDRAKVKAVAVQSLVLENKEGGFILDGLAAGEETAKTKVSSLMNSLLKPQFDEALGKRAEVPVGAEVLKFTVNLQEGEPVTYTYFASPATAAEAHVTPAVTGESHALSSQTPPAPGKADAPKKDEQLILVASNRPYAFQVPKNRVTELLELKRQDYVKAKTQEGAAPTTSPTNVGGANAPATTPPSTTQGQVPHEESGAMADSQDDSSDSDSLE